jgi:hypothetical protein
LEEEMKFNMRYKLLVFFMSFFILSLACSSLIAENSQNSPAEQNSAPTQANNNQTDANNNSVNSGDQVAEEPPPAPTDTPTIPTPTLEHIAIPNQPGSSVWLAEASSKAYAPEGRSIADAFYKMQLERPFTSQAMEYKDYLDITRGELSITSPFVYVTIFIEGTPPSAVNAHYGVEIDADQDGRGDWLVYGLVPVGTEWTVAGVRVYHDTNNDVGGPTPLEDDGPLTTLDGYDEILFNQGYETTDPDMAWIRRDPNNANRIQLAFKYSVIGSANTFLWGVWADAGPVEPAWFDYNDHYSSAQAGSPLSNSPDFPLNELAQVDNTCRWSYGFNPDGTEPGICFVPPTPTPTATPAPGNLRGFLFLDSTYNGVHDAGEPGFGGYTVTLGSGACPSSGVATDVSDGDGLYGFYSIPAGTYCVTVQITLQESCGGTWHSLTGKRRTITLGAGQTLQIPDMGFELTGPC